MTASTADLDSAIRLVDKHSISFWDAMLRATATRAQCGYLFSEDIQDGSIMAGVRIVNPFTASQPRD